MTRFRYWPGRSRHTLRHSQGVSQSVSTPRGQTSASWHTEVAADGPVFRRLLTRTGSQVPGAAELFKLAALLRRGIPIEL